MSNSILLLTEKYRPNTLADIKGNPSTISMLDSWVKARNIRNSYFFGPPVAEKHLQPDA